MAKRAKPEEIIAKLREVEVVGVGLTRVVSLRPWTRWTLISIVVFGGNSGSVRPNLKNQRT